MQNIEISLKLTHTLLCKPLQLELLLPQQQQLIYSDPSEWLLIPLQKMANSASAI